MLEKIFGIRAAGSTVKTEILAGLTTFMTMAYIFFVPLAKLFGTTPCVTAPALIVVGAMMTTIIGNIDWNEWTDAIPAFLTITLMPLCYSIAHGLAAGFIMHAFLKLVSGRWREAHWLAYLLAVIFLCRYIFLPWKFMAVSG